MNHTILRALAAGALMLGGIAATSQSALADGGKKYRVTVANATAGQPLAPGLIITHKKGFSLFEINGVASPGLAILAEFGNPGMLKTEVEGASGVKSADVLISDGPASPVALPGETNSIVITTSGSAKNFTAAGMLAATNDAFYAVRGIRLPRRGKITVRAVAYDAGAEANNEIGDDIQALSENAIDTTDNGEGFIHVHPGVQGDIADLLPIHDWRNPVVEITIERLRGHDDDDDD